MYSVTRSSPVKERGDTQSEEGLRLFFLNVMLIICEDPASTFAVTW